MIPKNQTQMEKNMENEMENVVIQGSMSIDSYIGPFAAVGLGRASGFGFRVTQPSGSFSKQCLPCTQGFGHLGLP